ncbi:hypothetical protein DFQ27_004470, partial [Actinomortierella ambigua]
MPSQAILLDETEEKIVEMDLDSEFSVAEVSDIAKDEENKENNPPSGIPVHTIANDFKEAVPFSSPFTFSFPMPPSHAIKCGDEMAARRTREKEDSDEDKENTTST